jgi:hypothetical protein
VYADLAVVSPECRVWSCQWLVDPGAGLHRPDHAHYVVDVMFDFVGVHNSETGAVDNLQVMQVWCDPDYPDAWRDAALRRHMEHVGLTRGQATIIRYDSARAIVVLPPNMMVERKWHEVHVGSPPAGVWTNPLDAIRSHETDPRARRFAQEIANAVDFKSR